MKNPHNNRFIVFAIILALFIGNIYPVLAQGGTKKNKVRLKLRSTKIMDSGIDFEVIARAKINKQFINIPNLTINLSNEVGDSIINLGTIKTNMDGKANFSLKSFNTLIADSDNTYNVSANFSGNDSYKSASKSISFKNAIIKAIIVKQDSTNYISATLTDGTTNRPLIETPLNVQVKRLFKSFKFGQDFYTTDNNGTILVPIPTDLPGLNKVLTFKVVLDDNDDYGTVKAVINAPLGTPIVDESTFDQRTLWSTRNKTPLFLLVFPNLLILAIWGTILYLIINLFKLSKSKN